MRSPRLTLRQLHDSENISESKLAFRRAKTEPFAHEKGDGKCVVVFYRMER